ncbi:MAG TPA: bifunctional YncE family protein/alkaline phosphatase family protein [Gemmatimonadaceae bacterium]|nr:bifunctional YncE family protein/alkaline phosphatase family protein [Gemmatimonadaceae bacterium]
MRRHSLLLSLLVLSVTAGCGTPTPQASRTGDSLFTTLGSRLPNGVRLDPAAPMADAGPMALTMRLAPEHDRVVLSLSGYSQQGLQVIDAASGRVLQNVTQPSAFVGLAFSPDGHTLYSSGGNQDVVYRYDWRNGAATLRDSVVLAAKRPRGSGTRYPAGLALSPDGNTMYVAENLADSLAVVDLASGNVVQRLATERYPYDVVADKSGNVYVSAWGGYTISVFNAEGGRLRDAGRITVARHPSALQLSADGSRLFVASGSTDHVAVVDTKRRRVIARLLDPPPAGPSEGSTPNALALSPDGTRLYVAEADANSVAVFDLAATTANVASATGGDRLAGRVPTGWYPTALMQVGDAIVVANGKGRGTRPNPEGPNPATGRNNEYSLGMIEGTTMRIPVSDIAAATLARFTARVTAANGWSDASREHRYPPFEHVIYIIKENRTYDQILGDDRHGDGDSALVFFPRASVSPNHHALADRFGIFDRFFVNAEVSPDGHNWSTAAYATDYLQKTVPSNYSGRGRSYDYEGTNGGFGMRDIPEDDVAEPASGYLWNLAERKGITFRNYGEFVVPANRNTDDPLPPGYRGDKPFLYSHTNPLYPGFDLAIKDQHRADVWISEFDQFVKNGQMPALEIIRLPNDHTSYQQAGRPTPFAAFADNDLALGRIVQAVSHSPYWKNTVIFVLEDDAQNGADHVDSHRSPLFVISAYNRPGAIHRFTNTTDVLRTIEEILGLASMSQFDYFGRPLRDIWASSADLTPYSAITPTQSLDDMNPRGTRGARASAKLDLDVEDEVNDDVGNRILWEAIKGPKAPYPGTTRMSAREARIGG